MGESNTYLNYGPHFYSHRTHSTLSGVFFKHSPQRLSASRSASHFTHYIINSRSQTQQTGKPLVSMRNPLGSVRLTGVISMCPRTSQKRRKKKLLFYIYAVIVKQNFYKRSSNHYSGCTANFYWKKNKRTRRHVAGRAPEACILRRVPGVCGASWARQRLTSGDLDHQHQKECYSMCYRMQRL